MQGGCLQPGAFAPLALALAGRRAGGSLCAAAPDPGARHEQRVDGAIGAGAFRGIAANRGYKAVLPLIAPRVPRYLLGPIGKNAAEIEAAAQGYGGLFLPTDAKKEAREG